MSIVLLLSFLAVAWCTPKGLHGELHQNNTNEPKIEKTMMYGTATIHYFSTPKKFTDAEMYCRRYGTNGHLVSIHGIKLNDLVLHLVKYSHDKNSHNTWIGGMRFLQAQNYIWTDGSKWDYNKWVPGEPNNVKQKEFCSEMYTGDYKPGLWNDVACTKTNPFVCFY
ncbi:lectin-like [Protopterus annectens]|uniref:lectin-like n=1 Tax=Protopterus annectens TaxID=7888 RepID=UPI001CF97A29|nr:lectin-like [Protopterus annectens]